MKPTLEKISAHLIRESYGACSASSEVALYRIEAPRTQGGGHVWPGGKRDIGTRTPRASATSAINGASAEQAVAVDATAVVLEFFARH
jgi:poly(3-hydroxybutyrate) depolymerase